MHLLHASRGLAPGSGPLGQGRPIRLLADRIDGHLRAAARRPNVHVRGRGWHRFVRRGRPRHDGDRRGRGQLSGRLPIGHEPRRSPRRDRRGRRSPPRRVAHGSGRVRGRNCDQQGRSGEFRGSNRAGGRARPLEPASKDRCRRVRPRAPGRSSEHRSIRHGRGGGRSRLDPGTRPRTAIRDRRVRHLELRLSIAPSVPPATALELHARRHDRPDALALEGVRVAGDANALGRTVVASRSARGVGSDGLLVGGHAARDLARRPPRRNPVQLAGTVRRSSPGSRVHRPAHGPAGGPSRARQMPADRARNEYCPDAWEALRDPFPVWAEPNLGEKGAK